MDERIVMKMAADGADEFDFDSGEVARVRPERGAAQIIRLQSAKNRKRAHTSNDPPNVPIDEHIGRHLKAIYDDVLNQPIPDRFLDLLNQLGDDTSTE